ncbi:MAG: hypothetical protein Q8N99_01725 [Nanoarchaeota archaeon]|nr:hypothetical protein [Nanoarchaeota archaeon]
MKKELHKKHLESLIKKRQRIKNYEKWFMLIFITLLTIYLLMIGSLRSFVEFMNSFGIIGIFFTGFFLGFSFTVIPATALLIHFSLFYNPFIIAFLGAFGKMFGDLVIFNYFKKNLPDEIEEVIEKSSKLKIFHKKNLHWIAPAFAGLVLLSPLPDEIAVSFLGIIKFKTKTFLILSFILNFIGILLLTGIIWLI